MSGSEQGVCASGGFCAFSDPSCDTGLRYEPKAGDGLAGTCAPSVDAGVACGAVGETCCATAEACVAGASCTAGTCTTCLQQIGFGRRFSCTLHADGTVWCAGENNRGQLGAGVFGVIPNPTPTQVRDETSAFIVNATRIGTGRDFACAIRADTTVWCWGANDRGQLGLGSTGDRSLAEQVVLTDDTPLTGAVAVTGGENHACALTETAGVLCWGNNDAGQLGDGTTTTRSKAAPVLVAAGGEPLTGALELRTGGMHNCVRKTGDDIVCWGNNANGQLGDGTETNRPSPLVSYTAATFALGRWHTCAVNADSTIACWGWNGHARLGIGSGQSFNGADEPVPKMVLASVNGSPFTGAASLAAGGVTCALMLDKTVYCWADNPYGQTGTGAGSTVPVQVTMADGTPLADVAELVAQHTHVCARRENGELLCWGRNLDGDLGDGTLLNRGSPTPLRHACP